MEDLLNFEKRTGIKNDDIDDFLRKANEVEEAIRALKDGKINPDEIKIAGIETEEEKLEKEKKRLARREELRKEEEALKLKRKQEEKERWWSGAELYVSPDNNKKVEESDVTPLQFSRMDKYSANYSRWDQWIPQDPATLQENELKQREEEEKQNKAFEENNKEFCTKFLADMEERKKESEKKKNTSTTLKLKGNKLFKAKKFEEALSQYMEALKLSPFDGTAILTNIAQAHIQLTQYEDALEFLNRALYLDPNCIKALSRKAFIYSEKLSTNENNVNDRHNNLIEAVNCITKAYNLDPNNNEIKTQYIDLTQLLKDFKNEQQVNKLNGLINQTNNDPNTENNIINTILSAVKNDSLNKKDSNHSNTTANNNSNNQEKNSSEEIMNNIETITSFSLLNEFNNILIAKTFDKLNNFLFESILSILNENQLGKIYFRKNEILGKLIENIQINLTNLIEPINSQSINNSESSLISQEQLVYFLQILNSSIINERSSKVLIFENYSNFLTLNIQIISNNSFHYNIIEHILNFIHILLDENYQKLKTFILKKNDFTTQLKNFISRFLTEWNSNTYLLFENSIYNSCIILKDLILLENGYQYYETETQITIKSKSISTNFISLLGTILLKYYQYLNLKKKQKYSTNKFTDIIELIIEILLFSSQRETLRSIFIKEFQDLSSSLSLSSSSSSPNEIQLFTTTQCLIQLCNTEQWIQLNSFGILLNLTIQSENIIYENLINNNIFNLCIQLIQNNLNNQNYDDTLTHLRIRSIGLLSRLCLRSEIQLKLSTQKTYLLFIQILQSNLQQNLQIESSILKWIVDERSYIIRLFASFSSLSLELRNIAINNHLITYLFKCLPEPRRELNEFTPSSVILPPNSITSNIITPVLVGNIIKCLILFANFEEYFNELFLNSSNYSIEKLVCMMATCSDIRVRKNIAILLAKGCRQQEIKKKIEYFRGIEMIVQLQKQLI